MTKSKEYILTPGVTLIWDAELYLATVLKVVRENQIYYNSNGVTPSDSEFLSTPIDSSVEFLNSPGGSGTTDVDNENVRITFKY